MSKKGFIKAVSLLLALLTFSTVLFACAEPDQPSSGETKAPGNETADPSDTRVTSDLEEKDLDGYVFTVLTWYATAWPNRMNKDLVAEDTTGEPINDAVYTRNARLLEKYNFEIDKEDVEQLELIARIRSMMSTSEDLCDMVSARINDVTPVLLEGDFLDFERDVPYVNLEKPYWDQSIRSSLSFNHHSYLMTSSMNLSDQDATSAIAFNKKMARDYGINGLYEAASAGTWTFDTFYANMTAFDGDVNGDSKMIETDDVFGFLGGDDVIMSFFFGGGGTFTEKDDEDVPVYNFADEKNYDITDRVLDIMYDSTFLNHHAISNQDDNYYRSLFVDGHGLFFWMRMDDVITMRGEESIDFGILPIPKYEEAQANYLSLISQHTCGLMSVLRCEENPDTVGYCLEAISAASYYDLQKAYYDVTLKTKSARDDESQEMLDLIFAHRVIDVGEICNFGGFSSLFLRYGSTNMSKQLRAISSTFASVADKVYTDVEEFWDRIDYLDTLS